MSCSAVCRCLLIASSSAFLVIQSTLTPCAATHDTAPAYKAESMSQGFHLKPTSCAWGCATCCSLNQWIMVARGSVTFAI